jgi:hypothetical protein
LPNVSFFSAIHAEIKHPIHRKSKPFSANGAANDASIRRSGQRILTLPDSNDG